MKQTILNSVLSVVIVAAMQTRCDAADTPHLAPNTNTPTKPTSPLMEVITRRLTNDIPTRRIFNFDGQGQPTSLTNEFTEKVFLVPVQKIPWFNDESNKWEVVELQLMQPRLISETSKTNFQLQSR